MDFVNTVVLMDIIKLKQKGTTMKKGTRLYWIVFFIVVATILYVGYNRRDELFNLKDDKCKTHWNPVHMFYEYSDNFIGVGDPFDCKQIGEPYFENELEVWGDIFYNCTIYCIKPFCADECDGCVV